MVKPILLYLSYSHPTSNILRKQTRIPVDLSVGRIALVNS